MVYGRPIKGEFYTLNNLIQKGELIKRLTNRGHFCGTSPIKTGGDKNISGGGTFVWEGTRFYIRPSLGFKTTLLGGGAKLILVAKNGRSNPPHTTTPTQPPTQSLYLHHPTTYSYFLYINNIQDPTTQTRQGLFLYHISKSLASSLPTTITRQQF